MKKTVLYIIINAILLQTNVNVLFCQNYDVFQTYTPETSDFIKINIENQSLYTGQPNISIPIYTLKYHDISVPIYMVYDASGYRPDKPSGIIGLNWSLIAGSAVTRQANGVSDEFISTAGVSTKYGFLFKDEVFTNDEISSFSNKIFNFENPSLGYKPTYELSSDIFSFSLPDGTSGKFMLNNNYVVKPDNSVDDDEITVFGHKNYKIVLDIKRDRNYSEDNIDLYTGKITITTDNGMKYIFGGDPNSIEYSWNTDAPVGDPKFPYLSGCTVNAWKLVEIISPQNYHIYFDYFQTEDLHGQHSDITKVRNVEDDISSKTKTAYLKLIRAGNYEIEFDYSLKQYPFGSIQNPINEKLDNIYVKNDDNLIKQFNFTYEYENSIYSHRLLLKDFNQQGLPPYSFSYIKNKMLPPDDTHAIDSWGFYNGKDNTQSLVPSGFYYYNKDLKCISFNSGNTTFHNRDSNAEVAKLLVLDKITFPTGAQKEFEYEGHDYGKKYFYLYGNQFCRKTSHIGKAGGLRIKGVKIFDNYQLKLSKRYLYINDYIIGNNWSSGILLQSPNYFLSSPWSTLQRGITTGSPITYSEVVEIESENGSSNGFKIYYYNSHYDFPDSEQGVYSSHNGLSWTEFIDDPPANFNAPELSFGKHTSFDVERGQERKISFFNKDKVKTHEKIFTYNTNINRYDDNVTSVFFPNNQKYLGVVDINNSSDLFFITTYRVFTFSNSLQEEIEKFFDNNGNINMETTTEYIYENGLLKERTTTSSKNKTLRKNYYYPRELLTLNDYNFSKTEVNVLDYMVNDRNIVNIPLRVESYNNNNLIDANITSYKISDFSNNIVFPYKYWQWRKDTQVFDWTSDNIVDEFGNIIEYKSKDNFPTSIYWSYNNAYPIIKAEDAIYDDLNAWVTLIQSDMQAFMESLGDLTSEQARNEWATFNSALRGCLPDAQIKTYTYIPLVGLSSETDANGKTTYYEYDTFNRLVTIRDNDYFVVKHIDYHYRNNN